MLKVVLTRNYSGLLFLVLFSIFESSFRSSALMLFTLKNFQGCIVVYLSRFKPMLSHRLKICFTYFFILCCIGNFDRITHLIAFVNNFFYFFTASRISKCLMRCGKMYFILDNEICQSHFSYFLFFISSQYLKHSQLCLPANYVRITRSVSYYPSNILSSDFPTFPFQNTL